MKRILLLIIIFLFTFNGWIEDIYEKKHPSSKDIEKKLSVNYTNIVRTVNQFKTNYSLTINKISEYTNYTEKLLKIENLSSQPDKVAEYKIKYLDINKTLTTEQDDLNSILKTVNNTMDTIKRIKNNIMKSNIDSPKTISITSNIFNKYNNIYIIYKTNLANKKNDLILFTEKITDINTKIENRIKTTNKNIISKKENKPVVSTADIKKKSETKFKASRIKSKSLKIKPKSKKLLKEANKFFNTGKYNKALKLYNEAVKQDKKNYLAMENIAKIHLKKGNIDKAIEQINKAIKTFKEQ